MACSCSSLLLAFLSLLVVTQMAVGVAHTTLGVRNLDNCKAERLLPIALITNGILGVLLAVWGVWDAIRANSKWTGVPGDAERLLGPAAPDDTCVRCMEAARWLLSTAAVAWAALTLFLALRTRARHSPAPPSALDYCQPEFVSCAVILASMAVASVALTSLINVVFYVSK